MLCDLFQPTYLQLGGAYSGLYNANGRAYPDIAAQGSRFRVIVGGTDYSIGGTSASAPAVAGIIALVNDARLAKKLPPLGFLVCSRLEDGLNAG